MNEEMKLVITNIIDRIDEKRKRLEGEYKKTYQYKSSKKYRQADKRTLDSLMERRNTLVSVLNYNYTKDIKELEDLI